MKKLMFMLIAALAIGANAANVKWGVVSSAAIDGFTVTSGTAYIVGLLNADATGLTSTSFKASDITANGGTILAQADFSGSSYYNGSGTLIKAADFGVAIGTYTGYIALIADDDSIAAVSNEKNITLNNGSTSGVFTFQASAFSVYTPAPDTPDTDTPEPTSGVLMLVGAAMIALKRKQR